MKKTLLLLIVMLLVFALCITACNPNTKPDGEQTDSDGEQTNPDGEQTNPDGDNPNEPDNDEKVEESVYSQGLIFTTNRDGTCYLSGVGRCTDKEIIIPPTSPDNDVVTGIGKEAFKYGGNIVSIVLPDCLITIADSAFAGCKFLESINIPSSVTSIGIEAFEGCSGLKSIVVDEKNAAYKSVDGCLFTKDGGVLITRSLSRPCIRLSL